MNASARCRVFFAIWLTSEFGLLSEALALKREDFYLLEEIPIVEVTGAVEGARKNPGRALIAKVLLKQLRDVFEHGMEVERMEAHKHGQNRFTEHWHVPDTGLNFGAV